MIIKANSNKNFKFEKLIIWQKAMDFGEEINVLTYSFPEKEKFNLSSQIMRAVDSIALNISEGSIGQSNPENKRFIGYAIRSLAEVITCLYKAKRREYISEELFDKHYNYSFNLMNQMVAYIRKSKVIKFYISVLQLFINQVCSTAVFRLPASVYGVYNN